MVGLAEQHPKERHQFRFATVDCLIHSSLAILRVRVLSAQLLTSFRPVRGTDSVSEGFVRGNFALDSTVYTSHCAFGEKFSYDYVG